MCDSALLADDGVPVPGEEFSVLGDGGVPPGGETPVPVDAAPAVVVDNLPPSEGCLRIATTCLGCALVDAASLRRYAPQANSPGFALVGASSQRQ